MALSFVFGVDYPPLQFDAGTVATAVSIASGAIGGAIIGAVKFLIAYQERKDAEYAIERKNKDAECARERKELVDKHESTITLLTETFQASVAGMLAELREERQHQRDLTDKMLKQRFDNRRPPPAPGGALS